MTANVTSDADTVTFTYNDKPVGEPNPHFYEDGGVVIPFADVSHVETHNMLGLIVVTKHSRWDQETGGYANSAWVDKAKAKDFLAKWYAYRTPSLTSSPLSTLDTRTNLKDLKDLKDFIIRTVLEMKDRRL